MLRVAITADPYLPVPPVFYGGIERVIDLLARGLAARGHEITVFAHPHSRTAGTLHPYGAPPHAGFAARARELWQLGSGLFARRRQFDVVHSFGRLAAMLPVLPIRGLAKIQSYQRAVPWAGVRHAARLGGPTICFTGCSRSLYAGALATREGAGRWYTVFNPVDLTHYMPVRAVPADAPLVFLGRLERIKGPHHAIAIARAAGRRLVIAGNIVREGPEADFYDRAIAPHVDGTRVEYAGPVDDGQKNALLGSAAALLMPIEWDEPFGIVMAEAMACGTPVIGFARGSVPEVVRDGVTGFVCGSIDEAAAAVGRLASIARGAVRRDCEERFGHDVIVSEYERLYFEMLGRQPSGLGRFRAAS
jgi:glycosyltransferase involved in cell wall biosynthesis